MSLEDLPAMQFHPFQPWLADVCGFCGGTPAAHPSPEYLAECEELGVCPCCRSGGACAHWCRLKGGCRVSDETMTKHGRVCCPHESTGLCRGCRPPYPLPAAVNRMLKAENARLRERLDVLEGALRSVIEQNDAVDEYEIGCGDAMRNCADIAVDALAQVGDGVAE